MKDEQPTSKYLSVLIQFVKNRLHNVSEMVEDAPPALTQTYIRSVQAQIQEQADTLYARMQAEEQERAAMRGLLERFDKEFISSGRDQDQCCYCRAIFAYPQSILEHEANCPIAQARALLAKVETGKEQSDG